MKKTTLILVTVLLYTICYSQKNKFVGAWYWSDSSKTNRISLFVTDDTVLIQNMGLVKDLISTKADQNAKYSIKRDGTITFRWADNTVSLGKIKFINYGVIMINYDPYNDSKPRDYVFRRIIDEEVKKVD